MLKGVLFTLLVAQCTECGLYVPYSCWNMTDRYCSSCSYLTNSCNSCWNSWLDDHRGICRPPSLNITGCITYETFNRCGMCNAGYYLTSKGSCRPYDSSNTTCAFGNETACTYCTSNLIVPNPQGICDGSISCPSKNCLYCTSSGCSMCLPQFTLWRGFCVWNRNYPAWQNCLTSTETTHCTSCLPGYYVNTNGYCVQGTGFNNGYGNIYGPHCWYCWSSSYNNVWKLVSTLAALLALSFL